MRALFNKDIATGLENTGEGTNYSTQGPETSLEFRNDELAEQPLQFCYTLDPGATCTEEQVESLLNGTSTVCRYIVKDRNSTVLFPELMGSLEEEGCGSGVGAGAGGNGTGGSGGNGTVGGGGSPPTTPFEGAANGRVMYETGLVVLMGVVVAGGMVL